MNAHKHWSYQRITAMMMLFLIPYFGSYFFQLKGASYENWADFFANPCSCALWLMLTASILYHGYLGIDVITTDYIKCNIIKRTLLFSTQFVFIFLWLLALFALCKIIVVRSL